MLNPVTIGAAVIFGLLFLLLVIGLMGKQDATIPEEIAEASRKLEDAIFEAEDLVGKHAPHNLEARRLLDTARACLAFSGRNSRLVVSAAMIKRRRLEGIGYANQAAEIARAATGN